MLPATGSTMTAATSPVAASKRARTASRSLKGDRQRVAAPSPAVTPGLSGVPNVAAPEPALHEQAVAVAVIAAFELDDRVASGDAAGEPQRRHRRFRAGVDDPHHLDRRHEPR